MTWEEMSRTAFRAAKLLRNEGLWRSSVSRSYYAAYSAVVSSLAAGDFPRGWNNPPHHLLPKLIPNRSGIDPEKRSKLKRNLLILRSAREDADYRPHTTVRKNEAVEALLRSSEVLRELGID